MNASRLRSTPAALGLVSVIAAIITSLAVLSTTGPRVQAQSDPPERPTGLTSAAVSHNSVTLSWDDPDDDAITGYRILRRNVKTQEPGNFSNAGTAHGADATGFTDTGVEAETKYAYRIVAYNSAGDSPRSGYVNVTTPAEPASAAPDKPTGLVSAATHDSVLLSWNDPDDDSITGYRILRRDVANQPPGAFSAIAAITDTNAVSYTDSKVEAETQYAYRIVALNDEGASPESNTVSVTTLEEPDDNSYSNSQLRSDDVTIEFTNRRGSINEEDGPYTICVTASANPASNRRVRYETEDGTAVAGRDFRATPRTLTFTPTGDTELCSQIPLINDNIPEIQESFIIILRDLDADPVQETQNGQQVSVQPEISRQLTTIDDQDTAQFRVNLLNEALEGAHARFEVTVNPHLDFDLGILVRTISDFDGAATEDEDFRFTPSTLLFEAGVRRMEFDVEILADDTVDPGELFDVRLREQNHDQSRFIFTPDEDLRVTIKDFPPVSNLTATAGNKSAVLSWDPGDTSITSYQYRVRQPGYTEWPDQWATMPGVRGNRATYTVRNLLSGYEQEIEVRARISEVPNKSATVLVTPAGRAEVPFAPIALTASSLDGGLQLTWEHPTRVDPRAPITAFRVRHRPAGSNSGWTNAGTRQRSNPAATYERHSIDRLTNRRHYEVQVAAVNSSGTGAWSTSAIGTPQGPHTDPPATPDGSAPNETMDLGLPNATWVNGPGISMPHPDAVSSNLLLGDCSGTNHFAVLWDHPGVPDGDDTSYPAATQWEAHFVTANNAGRIIHRFQSYTTSRYQTAIIAGNVSLAGSGYLTMRVRGKFTGHGWSPWSQAANLTCILQSRE